MFRLTNPQSSLFEVDAVLPDALPKDDCSYVYNGCSSLFCLSTGRKLLSGFYLQARKRLDTVATNTCRRIELYT